jgi:hypothetical protein
MYVLRTRALSFIKSGCKICIKIKNFNTKNTITSFNTCTILFD